jgi:hypothetical protein
MTSSFRDPNRMGATNYLSTEADLSEAVNKQIDVNIQDTRNFYDQMVELEKQRFEQRDQNLALLTDFIKTAAPIVQQVRQANQDRNRLSPRVKLFGLAQEGVANNLLEETNGVEQVLNDAEQESAINEAIAKKAAEESDDTQFTRDALDAARVFGDGGFVVNDQLNSINNVKDFSKQVDSLYKVGVKDDRFGSLGNETLLQQGTRDEAVAWLDGFEPIVYQKYIQQRRALGLPELTDGQIYKYLAPEVHRVREARLLEWEENRNLEQDRTKAIKDRNKISGILSDKNSEELRATMAAEILGKTGWITNKKAYYEALGDDKSIASQKAFEDFTAVVLDLIKRQDVDIDPSDIANLLTTEFELPGGKMLLSDERAPRGARDMANRLAGAIDKIQTDGLDAENEQNKLGIIQWEKEGHPQFIEKLNKITDPRERADEVDKYLLEFRQRFSIRSEEQDPEYIKAFINREEYSDDAVVIEIRSRRRNNLPITQSMIDQIVDPDLRDEQSKFVNTPELGAFTEDEVTDLENEKIPTLVRDAKQLSDLSKAKTDKFLVARDNAKEYVTARFKELVIGGQSRTTALTNALKEAKGFLADGTFDKEEIQPIDVQATKDLQSTLNALGKDPSLIYSSEEWAGEAPHLAIAREYIRTKGRTAYPSYYMRFNFIKDTDGAYLTPEEIFETRVNKVDKKEAKIEEIPERKELDNIEDQNKLLNKSNATKTLEVASKNNNIEWMIKTKPSVSELNAEMFIRQLEINIQNQHSITGIAQSHRQKTTLSKEDSDKLLEAVPELKEAPFLNPNTLSTAAINAMLKLNI